MIDALRTARRPAPGFGWRALALYVGPALLVAATVLPTALLQGRLPRPLGPPLQDHPADYLSGAVVSAALLAAAWVGLLGVSRVARHVDRRMFWELWVPLLYAFGGGFLAFSVRALVLSLDRPFAPVTAPSNPLDLFSTVAMILAISGVGLLLGRRAVATELAAGPGVRAVWISDVDADLRWWLIQGLCALVGCLVLGVPYVLAGSWTLALETDVGILGCAVVSAAWASRGHVAISPWGVRVHCGHVPLLGWQVHIDNIASVEVGRVRLLRSLAAWKCLNNLALRDGPALVLRTRFGSRHVVTLPRAEDAAITLRTWLAEREVTPS
jgi:hypothetical protein